MKNGNTFLLGLTGSIGMGKTTTARLFAEAGIPVWSADDTVHKLYEEGGAATEAIAGICPDAITDGVVDREKLKAWISRDSRAIEQIEKAIHPLVEADRQDFIRTERAPVLVFDIPLLFEKGNETKFDAIAVVTAPPQEQRRRVLERKTMTEDMFETILARQMPDVEKRRRADYVIVTDSLEGVRSQVFDIIDKIRKTTTNA